MDKEEILKLVKKYFNEGGIRDDGSCTEYYGETIQFIDFAEKIYRKAYSTGHRDGYDDGWEGSKVSTEMNTWSSDDDL